MNSDETWFAHRLRFHRDKAQFTQEQLAEAMGVSEQTVRQWERGRKFPHLRKLPRLGEVLGVQPGSFFPGPSDPLEWPQVVREAAPIPVEPGLDAIEAQLHSAIMAIQILRKRASGKRRGKA